MRSIPFLQRRGTEKLAQADEALACNLSAEPKGIAGFYQGNLSAGTRDHHVLLQFDTWLGTRAAEAIRQWLS